MFLPASQEKKNKVQLQQYQHILQPSLIQMYQCPSTASAKAEVATTTESQQVVTQRTWQIIMGQFG